MSTGNNRLNYQNIQQRGPSYALDAVIAYDVAQCHDTPSAAYTFAPDRKPIKCSERFTPGPNQPKPFEPTFHVQYPLDRVARIPGINTFRQDVLKISDLYKIKSSFN